ncbi:YciI family protein [Rufibacter hautae]|uniref:YciI family protein n=1 Tax=Rufibacter hautae TaxID=2595005 RepID=UPI001CC1F922|nr:YciI family protein [Rufibacter hautae]
MVQEGTALILGPVLDLEGEYGAGVVRVDKEEEVITLIQNDPANGLNTYEYHPAGGN